MSTNHNTQSIPPLSDEIQRLIDEITGEIERQLTKAEEARRRESEGTSKNTRSHNAPFIRAIVTGESILLLNQIYVVQPSRPARWGRWRSLYRLALDSIKSLKRRCQIEIRHRRRSARKYPLPLMIRDAPPNAVTERLTPAQVVTCSDVERSEAGSESKP